MATNSELIKALLILKLLALVTCDYESLMSCGSSVDCWSHLDTEIIKIVNENLHNETDPCRNFWYYACGDWNPPKQQYKDNFGIAMEHYAKKIETLLVSELHPKIDAPNLLSTLQTYYKSCNDRNLQHADVGTYLDEMPDSFVSNWIASLSFGLNATESEENDFSWLHILAALRRYGFNGVIIEERATVANNDATKYVIELKMPDEVESFEKKFEIVNYFVQFGLVESATDRVWSLAAEIFDLELQLKQLRDKHNLEQDATFEESLTLTELKLKVPKIDWQTYFNVFLRQTQVSGELPIEINGIEYFKAVATLLTQTDNEILSFYILAHLCKHILDIRPKHCIDHMGVLFPLGMNYIYDRYIYTTRTKDEIALQSIFSKLKTQFKKYLIRNKLNLNNAELRYVTEKINKMTLRLGNLPRNVSKHYYEHHYDSVQLNNSNFHKNHWEMLRFRTTQQHIGFLPHSAGHIELDTVYVYDDIDQIRNAPYFVHEQNLLIVPMVFLQLPFFHHRLDTLLQYSLVGFILGHELNHGFEYDGICNDAMGNENSIGFGIRRKKEFLDNVKCFQQTPTESLVERMADVNGFQLAFDAYFDVGNIAENIVQIKSLIENVSERQLFFLNFAQFFCGELPMPIDHDRDDVRVNEVVRNSREFVEAFQCNSHRDGVKELKRCEMWRS